MTDEQLSAIRARAEAATPGPWADDGGNVYTEWSREEYGYEPQGTGFDEIRICEINIYNADISDDEVKANGEFIANARADIPALLAHIDELKAFTARCKAAETLARKIETQRDALAAKLLAMQVELADAKARAKIASGRRAVGRADVIPEDW